MEKYSGKDVDLEKPRPEKLAFVSDLTPIFKLFSITSCMRHLAIQIQSRASGRRSLSSKAWASISISLGCLFFIVLSSSGDDSNEVPFLGCWQSSRSHSQAPRAIQRERTRSLMMAWLFRSVIERKRRQVSRRLSTVRTSSVPRTTSSTNRVGRHSS